MFSRFLPSHVVLVIVRFLGIVIANHSCGSVVEHCVSSAKVVGSIPREHILTKKMYSLNAL